MFWQLATFGLILLINEVDMQLSERFVEIEYTIKEMWTVCIPDWSATNVANNYVDCTTTSEIRYLWKYWSEPCHSIGWYNMFDFDIVKIFLNVLIIRSPFVKCSTCAFWVQTKFLESKWISKLSSLHSIAYGYDQAQTHPWIIETMKFSNCK